MGKGGKGALIVGPLSSEQHDPGFKGGGYVLTTIRFLHTFLSESPSKIYTPRGSCPPHTVSNGMQPFPEGVIRASALWVESNDCFAATESDFFQSVLLTREKA